MFSQEVRCLPGLWVSDQADPSYPGPWAEQGWQVPLPAHSQWEHDDQGGRGQVYYQIPDEEGRHIAYCRQQLLLRPQLYPVHIWLDLSFWFCPRCSVWLWLLDMWRWQKMSLCTTSTWLSISWCLYWRRTGRTCARSTSRALWANPNVSIRLSNKDMDFLQSCLSVVLSFYT